MSTKTFDATTFDASVITFGKHNPDQNGGYNIKLGMGDSQSEIIIQTPKMKTPFGLSTDPKNPFKKSVSISFDEIDTKSSVKSFKDMIEAIDEYVINYAIKNMNTFFKSSNPKNPITEETVRGYFCSNIKYPQNEKYFPTFRSKVLYFPPNAEKNLAEKYTTVFWNRKLEEQTFEHLDKGDSAVLLIKPKTLWVKAKLFGVTYDCIQVKVYKKTKVSGYLFQKTADESDDEEETEPEPEVKKPVKNQEIIESDNEESGEEEDEVDE
jgi:hypothetical protein